MKKPVTLAIVGLLALTLTACGSSDKQESASAKVSAASEQSTTVSETVDVTDTVKGNLDTATADLITTATETEPGRVEIQTSIVDPRSSGSEAATQALEICKAGLASLSTDKPYVSVLEEDGTTFVLAGHPSYGPDCAEVE